MCEAILEYAHHMRTPVNRIILLDHERLLRPLKLYPHTNLHLFQQDLQARLVYFAWELLQIHRHHPLLLPTLLHIRHEEESLRAAPDMVSGDNTRDPHEETSTPPSPPEDFEDDGPFYYLNENRANGDTNEQSPFPDSP